MISAVVVGDKEMQERLSRIATHDANIIAKAVIRAGLSRAASNIRRHIPKSIRPRSPDAGIGTSLKLNLKTWVGKAGVGVGSSQRKAPVVKNRGKRRGVGVSARNLHWFALGTDDRYTGSVRVRSKFAPKGTRKSNGNARKFTGRLKKEKFGQFVRNYGAHNVKATMWKRFDELVRKLSQTGTKLSRADEFQALAE